MSPKKTSDNQSSQVNSSLSPVAKGTIIGGIAGGIEAMVNYPTVMAKIRLQDPKIPKLERFPIKDPLLLLRLLYRGFVPFVTSVVPVRAIGLGGTHWFRSMIKSHQGKDKLTNFEMLYSAFLGGASSSPIAGPNELIIARQTQSRGFFATLVHTVETQGYTSLTLGLPGTAARNGIYAAGVFSVSPYMKEQIAATGKLPESIVPIAGSATAGVISSILSQPFDTVKTVVQTTPENMSGKTFTSMYDAAKKINKEKGILGFYKGGLPRGGRVISATYVIGEVENRLRKYLGW